MGATEVATGLASGPDRTPVRVIPHPRHQSGAQRVGDDIAGDRDDIFFAAQRSVVITRHPCSAAGVLRRPRLGRCRCNRLHPLHQSRQPIDGSQRQEQMHVVGHEHPAKQSRIAPQSVFTQYGRNGGSHAGVGKQARTTFRDGGQQVDLSGIREPGTAQRLITRGSEWRHPPRLLQGSRGCNRRTPRFGMGQHRVATSVAPTKSRYVAKPGRDFRRSHEEQVCREARSRLPSLPRTCRSGFSRDREPVDDTTVGATEVATKTLSRLKPLLQVRHHPYRCVLRICDSTAATAVMLTTRRGEEAGVRMCAGWSRPIRIGPIATPPVITRTML